VIDVRVRLQLPWGGDEQYRDVGPGWTDLIVRDGTDDEDVIREIWIEDVYRIRSLPWREWRRGRDSAEGRTVIDLGACTGTFSAMCLAYGAREVISVEPNPQNVEMIARNLKLAEGRGAWTVYHAAVGAAAGKTNVIGEGATGHTLTDEDGTIPTMRLDALIDRAQYPIGLVKCDVEGAEYPTFLACSHDGLRKVERIVMEWHGPIECPWLHTPRIGFLVEHLQYTHSVSLIGTPDRGGYLFAHRNDL
jgi:FkbM family methyltransferase